MKSTELRIGNFIYYSQSPEEDQPYDVFKTNLNDIHSLQLNESTDLRYSPIPLTEQWLIKLGFNFEDPYYNKGIYSCYRMYGEIKIANLHGFIANLKYVHELQNLFFALTRQELELIK